MAPLLYIAIGLGAEVVFMVMYVGDVVLYFGCRSDVLDVRLVHHIMLSCLREILLSYHSSVRLRLFHIY